MNEFWFHSILSSGIVLMRLEEIGCDSVILLIVYFCHLSMDKPTLQYIFNILGSSPSLFLLRIDYNLVMTIID